MLHEENNYTKYWIPMRGVFNFAILRVLLYKLRIAFSSCPKSQVTLVQRNAEIKLIPSQLVFQLQTVCKAIFMTFFQFLFFLLPYIFLGRMYNHVHIKVCNLFLNGSQIALIGEVENNRGMCPSLEPVDQTFIKVSKWNGVPHLIFQTAFCVSWACE